MDDFLQEFIDEATDLITKTNHVLSELAERKANLSDIDTLFRWIHTIKGGSAMMDFENTKQVAHTLENYLAECKGLPEKLNVSRVREAVDAIETLLMSNDKATFENDIEVNPTIQTSAAKDDHLYTDFENARHFKAFGHDFADFVQVLLLQKKICFEVAIEGHAVEQLITSFNRIGFDVIQRCDTDGQTCLMVALDPTLLIKAAPLIKKLSGFNSFNWLIYSEGLKSAPREETGPDHPLEKEIVKANPGEKKETTTQEQIDVVRVPLERVNQTLNSVWEVFLLKNQLSYLFEQNKSFLRTNSDLWMEIEKIESALSRTVSDVESGLMNMRMSPIAPLFGRMEKAVRQYLRTSNKQIKLLLEGSDTEVDKKLLDILGEPLIHLIRNAMDHGVETPDVRSKAKKDKMGTIVLSAQTTSDKLILTLTDDGNGIDKNRILNKALEKGLIQTPPTEESEIYDILFMPGFSTAEKVTEVSGRGVGMDVVKKTIASMGGEIRIQSKLGSGTTFHIELPLSMSLVSSLIVSIKHNLYALPITNLIEVIRFDDIEYTSNLGENFFRYRENYIQYVDLRLVYHKSQSTQNDRGNMVIFSFGEVRFGILVEHIETHTDIVVKEMNELFYRPEEVVGISILGTGVPVSMLSPEKIFKIYCGKKEGKRVA